MSILLLIAGFCVLCLSGCIGVLLIAQKQLTRAFDMVDFCANVMHNIDYATYRYYYNPDENITRKEGTE